MAIIDHIVAWLDDVTDPRPIMWMNGAAGAGKSAIAQTVAKLLYDQGRLAASFFYSNLSADPGRQDDSRVVPTLSYQLLQNIPETRGYISAAIEQDELLFDLTLEAQLQKLIVDPISLCSETMALPIAAKIVIIDGLDESSSRDTQRRIIRSLVAAFIRISAGSGNLPHKLLIASRPEQHLKATFSEALVEGHVSIMHLDYHPDVYNDIRKYLALCFSTIKRTHPLRSQIDAQWPTRDAIDDLVKRSSGQFIYVATVKKYIESDRHDPISRLDTIISLAHDPGNAPYADLDTLYKHILMHLADETRRRLVLRVLFVLLHQPFESSGYEVTDYDQISLVHHLFNVPKNDILLALADLSSILTVNPHGRIKLFHASFPDFLFDKSRSGRFYIRADALRMFICRASFGCIPRCKQPSFQFDIFAVSEDRRL